MTFLSLIVLTFWEWYGHVKDTNRIIASDMHRKIVYNICEQRILNWYIHTKNELLFTNIHIITFLGISQIAQGRFLETFSMLFVGIIRIIYVKFVVLLVSSPKRLKLSQRSCTKYCRFNFNWWDIHEK